MRLSHASATKQWPTEPGSGRGRSHGTSSREPFDRWFRYPAGFASDYVDLLLDRLNLTEGWVVDCFAGSGVTGTAARARGLGFAGIEAHPLIAELARLKLIPTATGSEVRELATEVVALARAGERRASPDLASEPVLLRRSFADATLRALVAVRALVRDRSEHPAGLYLKWALLGTLRDVAGVKVGWPYQRPGVARTPRHGDPVVRFLARAEIMADDLDTLSSSRATTGASSPPAQVVVGDSRSRHAWTQLVGGSTACIASPPYLNNFDYADATRLELYFWGEVTTWSEMCRDVRGDMLTATTQQSSVREMKAALERLGHGVARKSGPADEVVALVESIREAKQKRGRRSKEYDQVIPAYFVAMSEVLQNLHEHLGPGSTSLWLVGDSAPYGVYVDTPRLIGELAEQCGFDFTEDVSLRVRGNRWGQNADRHKVPLAERLIVFRKGTENFDVGAAVASSGQIPSARTPGR